MNIAFDSTALLAPMSKNRGIGNYALAQFKAMLEIDKTNQYFCLNYFDEAVFGNDTEHFKNLKEYSFWGGKDRFLFADRYYQDIFKDLIRRFIKKNDIDIFYVTSPFDGNTMPYQRDWFGDTQVVATVYDIIPYVMKDHYLSERNTREWYMRCVESAKRFDRYLAISNSVKNDLMRYLNIDGSKIAVIHGAAGSLYRKMTIPDAEGAVLLNKYHIKDKFILCTGGDDDRKNIKGTIEAFSKIPQTLLDTYQLVIVCRLSPHAEQLYTEVIASCKLTGRVVLTNYVTDEELLLLYNLASLMAFPSKYEGFGLPVVEAFACGLPVLTSNNSSLGEIAEGAAVLVDPFNTEDITRGLTFALTEVDTAQHIKNGYEKLALYNWDNVARTTLCILDALPKPEKELAKRKLAYFTPLPPIESGISDYSVDILNGISAYFDIDVFIDDGYKPACPLSSNIHVYNHRLFKDRSGAYFNIVYHMGNSNFHTYMYPYIKKHAGVVVLHDYNLHGTAYSSAVAVKKDYKLYREYLLKDYPAVVVDRYLENLRKSGRVTHDNDMELNGFITDYAQQIIVHSDEAKEKLLRKNIKKSVRVIRSYAKIEPLKDSARMKEKYGYSSDTLVIASFGHVHESKRIMPALKAFHQLSKQYENIFYLLAGKLDPILAPVFNDYLAENGLKERVTVTGYTDLEAFKNYIEVSDICLNLRYPYNGETSGSLMRVLSRGKCVVVNDIGSFSEIPDDCCVKLPNAGTVTELQEVGHIVEALEQLISDNALREELARAARKYAEEYLDIAIIAKRYEDCLADKHAPALNESILQTIIDNELTRKNYSKHEIKRLSETLAYTL